MAVDRQSCEDDADHEGTPLNVHLHSIVIAKSLATVRAFPRTINETVLHAAGAENVATRLEAGIFEVRPANLALQHVLGSHMLAYFVVNAKTR